MAQKDIFIIFVDDNGNETEQFEERIDEDDAVNRARVVAKQVNQRVIVRGINPGEPDLPIRVSAEGKLDDEE